MSWTDDRIGTLKKMWQQGKSASEIAEKLGGVTRNAVIGKAHRLGLSGRPSPIKKVVKKVAPAAAPAKKAAAAPSKAPVAAASKAKAVAPVVPVKAAPSKAAPAPIAKSSAPPPRPTANAPGKPAEIVQLAALANATSREDGLLVSILELTERVCRWPVGDPKDPNFGYCGNVAYEGHPYCAEHVAIAFQAPNRKDKKPIKNAKEVTEVEDIEDIEVEIEDDDTVDDTALDEDLDDDSPVTV